MGDHKLILGILRKQPPYHLLNIYVFPKVVLLVRILPRMQAPLSLISKLVFENLKTTMG